MQVGVLQFFSWPNREVPLAKIYERAEERVQIMDQNPYDAVWLAEHHFSSYSVCPSIHVMAAHFAAQTKNLRLGTGVTLAAFYNPLRIAEEIALLDVLSGGRINFGAGPGFDRREFGAFGVPPEEAKERFREAVAVVQAAWSSERLSFEGRFFQAEDLEVLPKPLQKPGPPTWVAATSEPSVRWAAEQGYQILMDPHSPHSEIARKRHVYFDVLKENGHSAKQRVLPTARMVAIADTDSAAFTVAERAANWTAASYIGDKVSRLRHDGKELSPVDHYLEDVMIHGSPERVADQLIELEESQSLNYLLLSPLSEQTFKLFNDHVLPKLNSAPATRAVGE